MKTKNLLKEGDTTICKSPEDREAIVGIAVLLGIPVFWKTYADEDLFPNLGFSDNHLIGLVTGDYDTELSPAQLIAKMMGIDIDKDKKIKQLEEQIHELHKKLYKLKNE